MFLAGPTAVGKSAVAIKLARALGGEIVSVDSMQVYCGLDLGTAKPSAADRAIVPHHLLDVVDLSAPFDAAQFVAQAQAAHSDIAARGRRPIFCGGTGLYFKALLEGLGPAPPASPELRREFAATPLHELLRQLAERDPAAHARIDRRNRRRVERALEIVRLTGQPVAAARANWPSSPQLERQPPAHPPAPMFVVLTRAPADLRVRIEARVDEMFARGLVAETQRHLESGLAQNPTAMQAIGYRQVVEYLAGQRSLTETVALVKQRTRQFAKRQITWFRNQVAAQWITIGPNDLPAATALALLDGPLALACASAP